MAAPEKILSIKPSDRLVTPDEVRGYVPGSRWNACSNFYGLLAQLTDQPTKPLYDYAYRMTTGIARDSVEVSDGRKFSEVSPDSLEITEGLVELLNVIYLANIGVVPWGDPKKIPNNLRQRDFFSTRYKINMDSIVEARHIPTDNTFILDWYRRVPYFPYERDPGISPIAQMRCDAIPRGAQASLEVGVSVGSVRWKWHEGDKRFIFDKREYMLSAFAQPIKSSAVIASGAIDDLVLIQQQFMRSLHLDALLDNRP